MEGEGSVWIPLILWFIYSWFPQRRESRFSLQNFTYKLWSPKKKWWTITQLNASWYRQICSDINPELTFQVFNTGRPRAPLLCLPACPSVCLSHLRSAGSAEWTSNIKISSVPRTSHVFNIGMKGNGKKYGRRRTYIITSGNIIIFNLQNVHRWFSVFDQYAWLFDET